MYEEYLKDYIGTEKLDEDGDNKGDKNSINDNSKSDHYLGTFSSISDTNQSLLNRTPTPIDRNWSWSPKAPNSKVIIKNLNETKNTFQHSISKN